MSQYAINDTSLTAIGDAIRAKKGEDKYLYLDMLDTTPEEAVGQITFTITQEQWEDVNKIKFNCPA